MKSDKSRETFHPEKHYSSVRFQQGRVATDADWNEQSDIIQHRDEVTNIDVIGRTGVPETNGGFALNPSGTDDLLIGAGRMYIDGLLVESEDIGFQEKVHYQGQPTQPDLLLPPPIPTVSGVIVAYLDVWQRHIDAIEDPLIREVALGGPDTATRAKTIWQVKILPITSAVDPTNFDVASTPEWQSLIAPSTGELSARAEPTDQPFNPCTIPQSAGFRRLENQLYRVEIHTAGDIEFDSSQQGPAPTFKWSRDNGSISAPLLDADNGAGTLTVQLQTTDTTRGFSPGQWVEVIDDKRDLDGHSGVLVKLTQVNGEVLTYDPTSISDPVDPTTNPLGQVTSATGFQMIQFLGTPRVRRWDMTDGPIVVIGNDGTDASWIDLEDGVQVRFEFGTYKIGDYWEIPARTLPNLVEWPGGPDTPLPQPPLGIQHHIACLSTYSMPGFMDARDCRKFFKPLTELDEPGGTSDQPQPGEFRYYLIDGDNGDDSTGQVGKGPDSVTALANAVPFLSIHVALAEFPRDGNDSLAIVILKARAAGDGGQPQPYPDPLSLTGLNGYRRILIRGSDFNLINQQPEPIVLGAFSLVNFTSGLVVAANSAPSPNRLTFSDDIGVEPAQLGKRVRFAPDTPNTALRNTCFMALAHGELATVAGAVSGSFVDLVPPIPSTTGAIGGNDRVFIEFPAAQLNNVFLEGALPDDCLTVAGLNVTGELLIKGCGGEMSFCQLSEVVLENFGGWTVSNKYTDELGMQQITGVGVSTGEFISNEGASVVISDSFLSDFHLTNVTSVEISESNLQSGGISQCSRFDIGISRGSAPAGSPFFFRLGANGPVSLDESDGSLAGVLLEGQLNVPSLILTGLGQSLQLDDIDVTVKPSGIILDATTAVGCEVLFNPQPSFVPSGLFLLPQNALLRPFELSQTDQYDAGNNHYHASLLSFVNRGLAVQKSASEPNPISRYFVTQYDGTTTGLRVKLALATDGSAGTTRLDPSAIAGIAQQEIRIGGGAPNAGDASSVHVTSGYSLVALSFFNVADGTVTLPAPVFVSDTTMGTVTIESSLANPNAPRVRVGVLIKIINYGDNAGGWSRFGLVRLQLDAPPV